MAATRYRLTGANKVAAQRSKGTLLSVLGHIGDLPGCDITRTPGEEAAIRIASALILNSSLEELQAAANKVEFEHGELSVFWGKQWAHR